MTFYHANFIKKMCTIFVRALTLKIRKIPAEASCSAHIRHTVIPVFSGKRVVNSVMLETEFNFIYILFLLSKNFIKSKSFRSFLCLQIFTKCNKFKRITKKK